MNFIKTTTPGVMRDPYSKAIHFVDDKARNEYLDKQRIQDEINTLRSCIEHLHGTVTQEISEIKNLIISAITKGT